MTDLRTAAQQALEALHVVLKDDYRLPYEKIVAATDALRAALAEPVQEPFCYVYEYDSPYGLHREFYPREYNGMKPSRTVPLYAAPPPRKPLTEEEIDSIWDSEKAFADIYAIARAIERAHGIKE